MKKSILSLLFLFASSGVLTVHAAEYGQPYGAKDETPMEAKSVKSIEEVNEVFEVIAEEPPPPEESEEPVTEESEEPATEEQQDTAQ